MAVSGFAIAMELENKQNKKFWERYAKQADIDMESALQELKIMREETKRLLFYKIYDLNKDHSTVKVLYE